MSRIDPQDPSRDSLSESEIRVAWLRVLRLLAAEIVRRLETCEGPSPAAIPKDRD
jgi:hypothetical protein